MKILIPVPRISIDELFVYGIDDSSLGQKLILLIENTVDHEEVLKKLTHPITKEFNKYHLPKELVSGVQFKRTNGKIKRKETTEHYF